MPELKDWSGLGVGIELKNDSALAVAVEPNGSIFDEFELLIEPEESTLDLASRTIRSITGSSASIDSIGIAVPGLIDQRTGLLVHSKFIDLGSGEPVSERLSAATGVRIALENDANAAAIAEYQYGAGRGSKNMFYATLGEGIGAALIIDGSLWRGDSGFAGELGNIAINSEGMRLEEIASSSNIVRRTQNRIHQDSTSSLSRLSEDEINITEIVRAAKAEDDFALLMLERTGTYVGTAIATVINLLNVELIVIGGEIMDAGDVVLEAIIQRAREFAYLPAFRTTRILRGSLGSKAAAIGAAMASKRTI
ncbi:ROK family protein [Leptolyngbya sp. 7M]|uniref:ROK family protein n=1 Tax=Leptolyngbya sp. 7M TaxID=2812896 RepID=UPI001B8BE211|nr:ROK family protein [Leptolyngbya sp. 7M]QYO65745.1 ROK family protein [Leptolyngbya sp. 7M]